MFDCLYAWHYLYLYSLPASIFNVCNVMRFYRNRKSYIIVTSHFTQLIGGIYSQSLLLFIIIICLRGWIFLMWLYPCNGPITESSRLLRNDAYNMNSSPAKPANVLPFPMPAVCCSTLHAYKHIVKGNAPSFHMHIHNIHSLFLGLYHFCARVWEPILCT